MSSGHASFVASPAEITDAVTAALEKQFGSGSFEAPMGAFVVRQ